MDVAQGSVAWGGSVVWGMLHGGVVNFSRHLI